jgi:heme exporter protein D
MKSLGDFVAMGGYGFFVWGSYAVTALLVVIEAVAVRARFKAARALARKAGRAP